MSEFMSFGEIMLRLKAPGHERFFQSPDLEATFGGGEANVAVSLANYGFDAGFISALPDNAIGESAIRELWKHGVNTDHVARQGERVGIYYLERGANQRPSNVIYDRKWSSICEAQPGDIDWDVAFAGTKWFHFTGITPAISESAAALTLESVKAAKRLGITVSCDFNYRGKLWNYGKTAPEVMTELVKYVDVGIANEEDCQKSLGITADIDADVEAGHLDTAVYEALLAKMFEVFPDLSVMAITLRESISADYNGWAAAVRDKDGFYLSRRYDITHIIDRVGGGDSFASAFIAGMNLYDDPQESLEFAVAGSALKHTIKGDFNRVNVAEVQKLMGGDGSGRVSR